METNQKIPDFLESYCPEDKVVKFDDDTDDENEKNDNTGGGIDAAWGGIPMESGDAPAADDPNLDF